MIPPSSESTALSVRSWRTTRLRLAPNAMRTATSRCRTVARASSRLATLTTAIKSTSAIAPSNTSKAVETSLTIHSFMGIITPTRSGELGYCAVTWAAMSFNSATALRTLTPGLSLPRPTKP